MLSSAAAVNEAATAICANQKCKNWMRSYTDILITCRVGSINDDDGVCCRYIRTCSYMYSV